MDQPKRKPIRLPDYDYSAPGAYFVTICTHERRCILSSITVGEGLAPPEITLTPIGKIVEEQILAIPKRYPAVSIDTFVIMPNHIHLIVSIHEDAGGASPSPAADTVFRAGGAYSKGTQNSSTTLFDVVRVLKSLTTRLSRGELEGFLLWQRSYHEHVIRNRRDYQEIWEYIDANPAKWAEDRYYAD